MSKLRLGILAVLMLASLLLATLGATVRGFALLQNGTFSNEVRFDGDRGHKLGTQQQRGQVFSIAFKDDDLARPKFNAAHHHSGCDEGGVNLNLLGDSICFRQVCVTAKDPDSKLLHGTETPSKRPNVIFILTDDQGWGDAHFAGHPYAKTPNLDRLASGGTWFKQFYVAATVCSASRAAFMTSHYPARHQIHGHFADHSSNAARSMPNWLDPSVTTLPDLLRSAGYATAHFGKWHLGSGPGAPPPEDYGFDVSKTVFSNGPPLANDTTEPYFRAKSTRLIVDETIEFIRGNRQSPFYVNMWTLLPHAKLKPTSEQLAVYTTLQPNSDDPAFGPWMQKYLAKAKDVRSQMRVFCAALTDLDTQVGRLLDALDEMKLAENTIIIFSSDNGPEDYRINSAANAGTGSTSMLRGRKRSMYEGGIRTFGLVRWPGTISAGRVDETNIVGAVDLLPTVAALAGVKLPETLKPDGEDLSSLWLGNTDSSRTQPLYWEWLFNVKGRSDGYMPPMLAIREGDWKLFVNHNGAGAQFYNIAKDPGETQDLSAQHPTKVKALTEKMLAWVKTLPPSPARDEVAATGLPVDGRPSEAPQSP